MLSRTSGTVQLTREDVAVIEQVICKASMNTNRGKDARKRMKKSKRLLRLKEDLSIRIAWIKRHRSLRIYLLCDTKQDLLCLRGLYDSKELLGILTRMCNELLDTESEHRTKSRVVVEYASLVNFCSCLDYFLIGTCTIVCN